MSKKETSSARDVAEVAEEAARIAIERAQAVESRLDQFGTARHLESEPVQTREEADRILQLAQETKMAGEAKQAIRPLTPQNIDEEDDSEEH